VRWFAGSARNFRRLVAEVKAAWRAGCHRPSPGGVDVGRHAGHRLRIGTRLHAFCAAMAWSRFWFVRFAGGEKPAPRKRPRHWACWLSVSRCSASAEDGAGRPDGLPESWRGRQRRGVGGRVRAVRHPLRVPARLLRQPIRSRRGSRSTWSVMRIGTWSFPRSRAWRTWTRRTPAAAGWCAEVNAAVHLQEIFRSDLDEAVPAAEASHPTPAPASVRLYRYLRHGPRADRQGRRCPGGVRPSRHGAGPGAIVGILIRALTLYRGGRTGASGAVRRRDRLAGPAGPAQPSRPRSRPCAGTPRPRAAAAGGMGLAAAGAWRPKIADDCREVAANEIGEPNGEPMSADVRPHRATTSHSFCS
jgi:hypothetical protein